MTIDWTKPVMRRGDGARPIWIATNLPGVYSAAAIFEIDGKVEKYNSQGLFWQNDMSIDDLINVPEPPPEKVKRWVFVNPSTGWATKEEALAGMPISSRFQDDSLIEIEYYKGQGLKP